VGYIVDSNMPDKDKDIDLIPGWRQAKAAQKDAEKAAQKDAEKAARPLLSGSMALKCRRMLWLKAHGAPEEPILPGTQRTFDLGILAEAAMLHGVDLPAGRIYPWWGNLGAVRDHAADIFFLANESPISDFQREVSFAGITGHIDALVKINGQTFVLDVKTTQGFGYNRHKTGDLMADPFAREYVGQLHFYMAGLKAEGVEIAGGILLFFNKLQSQVMARFVAYDESIVAEIIARLDSAKLELPPKPDWDWEVGEKIPLRCSYCSLKTPCAESRGVALLHNTNGKGEPEWIVEKGDLL
jgi:hypothetical protein